MGLRSATARAAGGVRALRSGSVGPLGFKVDPKIPQVSELLAASSSSSSHMRMCFCAGEGILVLLNAARIKMCNAFEHQAFHHSSVSLRDAGQLRKFEPEATEHFEAQDSLRGHPQQSDHLGCCL